MQIITFLDSLMYELLCKEYRLQRGVGVGVFPFMGTRDAQFIKKPIISSIVEYS